MIVTHPFFHAVLKRRKKSNLLRHMVIDGVLVEYSVQIANHVLNFCKNLFSEELTPPLDFSLIVDVIPSMVTAPNNEFLIKMPCSDEIRGVVFDMDHSSALGLDGSIGFFLS